MKTYDPYFGNPVEFGDALSQIIHKTVGTPKTVYSLTIHIDSNGCVITTIDPRKRRENYIIPACAENTTFLNGLVDLMKLYSAGMSRATFQLKAQTLPAVSMTAEVWGMPLLDQWQRVFEHAPRTIGMSPDNPPELPDLQDDPGYFARKLCAVIAQYPEAEVRMELASEQVVPVHSVELIKTANDGVAILLVPKK